MQHKKDKAALKKYIQPEKYAVVGSLLNLIP
jgi:hypothetical protein